MVERIRVLPPELATLIAAGEVVERPVSVVKELVENALDAQARRISVEVRQGGRDLIRVVDDGTGMSAKDARVAFQRHSTSKLARAQDLASIRTLGFRGEALAVIGRVARVDLRSRLREEMAGTRVVVENERMLKVEEAGCPAGTVVEVTKLFHQMPARRKFLKSAAQEMGRIASWMSGMAVMREEVEFRLRHNEREVFRVAAGETSLDRILLLYGRDLEERLIPFSFEDDKISVTGFLGHPGLSRSAPAVWFWVNGRPVRSFWLGRAVREGYGRVIPSGRFPVAFVVLDLPPREVDVNVHPTKREVRFANAGAVFRSVCRAFAREVSRIELGVEKQEKEEEVREPGEVQAASGGVKERAEPYKASEQTFVSAPAPREKLPVQTTFAGKKEPRVVGQLQETYIVVEDEGDLVLLDQHTAHERVLYERLRRQEGESKIESQGLVLPEVVEVDHEEAELLREREEAFSRLGFELEEFGPRSFRIRAVPAVVAGEEAKQLVREILDGLRGEGLREKEVSLWEKLLIPLSCRGAVKAGQRLEIRQMVELLKELLGTEHPYCCPHGRPTLIRFTWEELGRRFQRI